MKPISKTAYYCCGVRALDARRARPVCGDRLAERFMDEEAWRAFEPFRGFAGPNASNVTRHRILDDHLRERLKRAPDTRVVIVGVGFDTRAFRLSGGSWIEVDEPQICAAKDKQLPARECPNPLLRLAIDFETEDLEKMLEPHATTGPVFVVVEGVFMYLGEAGMRALLRTVRKCFPAAEIGCDLMSTAFFERFARKVHEKIRGLGAEFRLPPKHPSEIFASEGFRVVANESIQARSVAEGNAPWFSRLAMWLLPELREGYQIWVFESVSLGTSGNRAIGNAPPLSAVDVS